MDTKIFRYFTTLAEQRNFSRAAQELYLSPQGLNSAIRRLEAEVGQPLIEVRNGAVELTDFGRIFSLHAREMDESLAVAYAEVDALAARKASNIRIGCATGVLGYLGEERLFAFNGKGQAHVSVVEEVPDTLCERHLIAGTYDFALITNPVESPELVRLTLCDDYQFIWVNKEHPLSSRGELASADFAGQAVMTMDRSYKNTAAFERLLATAGVKASISYSGEMMRIYEFAHKNRGLGVTCRNHGESVGSSTVACLPFKCLKWGYSLCYRKDRLLSEAEAAYVDFMLSRRIVFD